jgi:hypothetical protein
MSPSRVQVDNAARMQVNPVSIDRSATTRQANSGSWQAR